MFMASLSKSADTHGFLRRLPLLLLLLFLGKSVPDKKEKKEFRKGKCGTGVLRSLLRPSSLPRNPK
jgi:hypothetical protein